MADTVRRAAVIGGNRIPFARSNGAYATASNQEMLTAALDGLVARFGLEGERIGEVAGGAVLKHSRDFNLVRESVLSTRLAPETAAVDLQQACGTGLQAINYIANKIKLGQLESGIGGGVDTTSDAPIAISEKLRKKLIKVNQQKDNVSRLKALGAIRPTDLGIEVIDVKDALIWEKKSKGGGDAKTITAEDRAAHYAVYAESVRNLGTPVFPKALFESALDAFGDSAGIDLISKDGRPLAAMIRFESDGTRTVVAISGRLTHVFPVGERVELGGKNVSTLGVAEPRISLAPSSSARRSATARAW